MKEEDHEAHQVRLHDHAARDDLVQPTGDLREIYSFAFYEEKQVLFDIKALIRERS